jgi:hypothetical protein
MVPNPPLAIIGVKLALSIYCCRVLPLKLFVMFNRPALIVMLKLAETVCDAASVTETVKFPLDGDPVGVPVIIPVVVLNDNPAGSVGLTEYTNGASPPVTGTGVVAVMFEFNVPVTPVVVPTTRTGGLLIVIPNVSVLV